MVVEDKFSPTQDGGRCILGHIFQAVKAGIILRDCFLKTFQDTDNTVFTDASRTENSLKSRSFPCGPRKASVYKKQATRTYETLSQYTVPSHAFYRSAAMILYIFSMARLTHQLDHRRAPSSRTRICRITSIRTVRHVFYSTRPYSRHVRVHHGCG